MLRIKLSSTTHSISCVSLECIFPAVCQFPLTLCLYISSLQFFYTRLQTLSSCVSVSLHCVSLYLVIAVLLHQASDLSSCVSVSLDSVSYISSLQFFYTRLQTLSSCVSVSLHCVSLYLIIAVLLHQVSDLSSCVSVSLDSVSYISSLQFFYTRLQTLSS